MSPALAQLAWAHARHHPGRQAVVVLAMALGVALAVAVQLINHSALGEFAQAVRATQGEPDVVLAPAGADTFDDALLERVGADEQVRAASPVLELETHARAAAPFARWPVRVLGVDALQVSAVAPALVPRPAAGGDADPWRRLAPQSVWLNAAARAQLGGSAPPAAIELQTARGWQRLQVEGDIAAPGAALVVLDIAAAQALFQRDGRLSRIDVRLAQGVGRDAWLARHTWPADVRAADTAEALERASGLSRAYRVNLSVLALVALLVGAFLVYSVTALAVVQRTGELALLGVLGLDATGRRTLVLLQAAAQGVVGAVLGLAGGAGLAALALRLQGGDLGGGYFHGVQPELRWPWPWLGAALALGVAAACAAAWWPARAAERLEPAQALKGQGPGPAGRGHGARACAALAAAGLLALAPPVAGLPLAAYASVALLLVGGVALVPTGVDLALRVLPTPAAALPLLAWRRAHHARHAAAAAVAGVVASLALAVAITVMVGSFRSAVSHWLDHVLPADLYARSAASAAAAEHAPLPPALVAAARALPGVARVQAGRARALAPAPGLPPVTLLARELGDVQATLPLVGPLQPLPADTVAVYASEVAAGLHDWAPGTRLELPLGERRVPVVVRGLWRDYARQFGALAIDLADYRRLSGDTAVSELALWLQPGGSPDVVARALREAAGPDLPLDTASTAQLRQVSLAIFDRSFAVTRYLQAVAVAVGLVGVAASLSAQVLARRKEFGLLAHLGLTRRQVVTLVALETLAWLVVGCIVGLALGAAMAALLVQVVNPQSFHWTMPVRWPGTTLALLALAMAAAGTLSAAWSARRATAAPAVRAVREDW